MCQAAKPYVARGYQLVVAGAPSVDDEIYDDALTALPSELRRHIHIVHNETYALLSHAEAALVTSGTATLETALFDVPQVVCYYTSFGRIVSWLRRRLLKVPYISLVNLVCNEEVVPELVADSMTVDNVRRHLGEVLKGGSRRDRMLEGYTRMRQHLGDEGAASHSDSQSVTQKSVRQKAKIPAVLSLYRPCGYTTVVCVSARPIYYYTYDN